MALTTISNPNHHLVYPTSDHSHTLIDVNSISNQLNALNTSIDNGLEEKSKIIFDFLFLILPPPSFCLLFKAKKAVKTEKAIKAQTELGQ